MRRNLLYHITPVGTYRRNLDLLRHYLPLFNGLRFAAVMVGKGLVPIEKVAEQLPGVELIPFENDNKLRETKTFLPLLREVDICDSLDITFYGHTKGVTRGQNPAVIRWIDALHKYNLDDIDAVEESLKTYPVTGACKRHGSWKHFDPRSTWHYSGTFFWLRNSALFSRDWNSIPQTRYGTEAYLSTLFTDEEAGCLGLDNFKDGYSMSYWRSLGGNHTANTNRGTSRSSSSLPKVDGKANRKVGSVDNT